MPNPVSSTVSSADRATPRSAASSHPTASTPPHANSSSTASASLPPASRSALRSGAGSAAPHAAATTAVGTTALSSSSAGQLTRIGQRLGERIGSHKFGLWFDRQTTRLRVEGGSLLVDMATPYVAEWISRHFTEELTSAAKDALGEGATVSLRITPDLFTRPDTDAAGAGLTGGTGMGTANGGTGANGAPTSGGASTDAGSGLDGRPARRGDAAFEPDRVTLLPPPLRRPGIESRRVALRKLDEFVAGPSNQLAFDAARRLAEGAPGATHLLFVHGDCGVGKTHLLQGICDRRRAMSPRFHVRYTTAEQFTNEYLSALREGTLENFRKALRRLDLLAIDDIHFLSNKTATQSEFLHTMDAIDLSGARIVLASDEHPRQIKKFSQSLVSRFLSGMVVRVDRPDRQTRISLVRRLAHSRGILLQPAAEEIVANRCVGSVREIEGALARLSAFASLVPNPASAEGEPATPNRSGTVVEIGALIAERAFEEESTSRPSGPIRIAEIVERVSSRLGVEREDVLGSGRHRRVVLARSIVVFLARELTTQSFPEIARALGRDTHSTAHTACKRIEQALADGERVETGDPSLAGPDGLTPLKELLAQLRHDVLRAAPRS